MSDERQEWETPQALWDGLHAEFKFDIDVAANADNAKLLQFHSRTIDGLAQSWRGKRVWCNPPYRSVGPWVDKAIAASESSSGALAVLLLPARVEQSWFRTVLIYASELAFFNARIQFIPPRDVAASSNREGSILAVFAARRGHRVETVRDAKTGKVLLTWERTRLDNDSFLEATKKVGW